MRVQMKNWEKFIDWEQRNNCQKREIQKKQIYTEKKVSKKTEQRKNTRFQHKYKGWLDNQTLHKAGSLNRKQREQKKRKQIIPTQSGWENTKKTQQFSSHPFFFLHDVFTMIAAQHPPVGKSTRVGY